MKKKLLLVEDSEDNRVLMKFALETYTNWNVIAISDGVECIDIAESEQPDAILLDFIMPKMDGLTVCQLLQDKPSTRTIPIIFVTGMVDSKSYALLENTHAAGVIKKPLDVNTLAPQIREICQWEKTASEV